MCRRTLICSVLLAMTVTAASAADLTLTFDRTCYRPGQTATATLSVSNLGTPAAGFQAFLSYDTAHLSFTGWSYPPASPFGLPVLNTLATVRPKSGIVNPPSRGVTPDGPVYLRRRQGR